MENEKNSLASVLRSGFTPEEAAVMDRIEKRIGDGAVFDNEMFARVRKAAKLSQSALAKLCGISDSIVSYWEIGKYKPVPEAMAKMIAAMGADVWDIYPILDEPAPAVEFAPEEPQEQPEPTTFREIRDRWYQTEDAAKAALEEAKAARDRLTQALADAVLEYGTDIAEEVAALLAEGIAILKEEKVC